MASYLDDKRLQSFGKKVKMMKDGEKKNKSSRRMTMAKSIIEVWKNRLPLISQMLMKIKILLLSLYPEIREKIDQQLPIQITLAELVLVTYITRDRALHALQNRNAIQCRIHSEYFLETNCWKKFVNGQMLKDYLFTKTSGLYINARSIFGV